MNILTALGIWFLASLVFAVLWATSRYWTIQFLRLVVVASVAGGVLFLAGCVSTPEGKRMQVYNGADIGTTAAAFAKGGVVETNPLGLAALPLKFMMVKHADSQPCWERGGWLRTTAGLWGGAAVNNAAVIAGSAAAVPLGVIAGIAFAVNEDTSCEITPIVRGFMSRHYPDWDG